MDNRNYLWLFLTIDIIEKSPNNFGKASSIDEIISNLPSEVFDAYETILARASNEVHARTLLEIVVAATRPLSLEEANVALSLALSVAMSLESHASYSVIEPWPAPNFKSIIKNMCGLFISVHDGEIFLINQTGRRFLLRTASPGEMRSDGWRGSLDLKTAHGRMSMICMLYLNSDYFANGDESQEGDLHCLHDYASINWTTHYLLRGAHSVIDLQKNSRDLCNVSRGHHRSWFKKYCNPLYGDTRGWTDLAVASFLRLFSITEDILDEGVDIDVECGRIGNALQAALSKDHDNIAHLLLNSGADVNARGGYFGDVLRMALYRGKMTLAKLLLFRGANVNQLCGNYGNILQAASHGHFASHTDVMQLLLDAGANVDETGGLFDNPPDAACDTCSTKAVQSLLESKAEVNAPGGYFGSALQIASVCGNGDIVELLLHNGANVNARGGRYGHALAAASFEGNMEVVELLLDRDADIHLRDTLGRDTLLYACAGGHREVAERLLGLRGDLSTTDLQSRNCLHHAASKGSTELITWLLKQGFDSNSTDRDGWTPLHWAAKNGSVQSIGVLKDAGPVLRLEYIKGLTPVSVALYHHNQDAANLAKTIAASISYLNSSCLEVCPPDSNPGFDVGFPYGDIECSGCFMVSQRWKALLSAI